MQNFGKIKLSSFGCTMTMIAADDIDDKYDRRDNKIKSIKLVDLMGPTFKPDGCVESN